MHHRVHYVRWITPIEVGKNHISMRIDLELCRKYLRACIRMLVWQISSFPLDLLSSRNKGAYIKY